MADSKSLSTVNLSSFSKRERKRIRRNIRRARKRLKRLAKHTGGC